MGAIPARPGPILLPSVPYRIGPGRAETDFLDTSLYLNAKHSKRSPTSRRHYQTGCSCQPMTLQCLPPWQEQQHTAHCEREVGRMRVSPTLNLGRSRNTPNPKAREAVAVFRSLGNGVRKNGVRNRCPYRRCGVDTEIPYRPPFWREFCLFLPVRVAPGVDAEIPYRVRIVDRGVDCRDRVCDS